LVLAACTSPATPSAAPSRPTDGSVTPSAAPSHSPDGIGRVASEKAARHAGTLFRAGAGGHFCSGTVVSGATTDLVVTAAHWLWQAARVTVDPRWTDHADPDLDVAFIELAPRNGQRVSDVVGAERIAFGTPGRGTVRLTGYPDGDDDPLTCLGTMTQRADGQLRVACTGYASGTSGTPWLTDFDPDTDTWAVVGVIGGYQQGGDTDDVSYSPYFGVDVQYLYQQAVQAA
jgi:hypothetical protein